jgi:hypothetical protein
MKTQFDISSPVKRLDMDKYGEFLSPASKRKYGVNMEHGHQCAGGIFLAGTDSDLDGMSEVLETKKPTRSGGQWFLNTTLGSLTFISNQFGIYGSRIIIIISQF